MNKGKKLYEGKAKILYEGPEKGTAIQHFKDDATAFNNQKKSTIEGKGILNNRISEHILSSLNQIGIETHLVKRINMREQLIKLVEIIPIEFVVRNIATGSLSRNLGIEDGKILPFTLVEFDYKNDDLGDPKLNDQHCLILELVEHQDELDKLRRMAREVNDILKPYFEEKGLNLVDFKLEFGKYSNGNIILVDEISPDTCRFWDIASGEKMDKDRFRQGLGGLKVAYEQVLNRILDK